MLALCSLRMRSEPTTGRHFDPEQGEMAAGRAILADLTRKTLYFKSLQNIRTRGGSKITGRIAGQ
jgi:hypothetical protein